MKNVINGSFPYIFVCFLLHIVFSAFSHAGTENVINADLEEKLTLINEELSEIKKEVLQIRKILETITKRRTPKIVTTSVDDDPFMGENDAPVTLVEFVDYECSFCGGFVKSTLSVLKDEYIKTKKLKYVVRDFPLEMHKNGQKTAEAVQCAGDQEKYWEMHDVVFDNQRALDIANLKDYAEKLGMDMEKYNSCLDGGKYAEEVKKDIKDGQKIGVRGTPSFVLGPTASDGNVKGKLIVGGVPYDAFKSMIDAILKEDK